MRSPVRRNSSRSQSIRGDVAEQKMNMSGKRRENEKRKVSASSGTATSPQDMRFDSKSDPRFRPPTERHRKLVLDKRFEKILHDEQFQMCKFPDATGRFKTGIKLKDDTHSKNFILDDDAAQKGKQNENSVATKTKVSGSVMENLASREESCDDSDESTEEVDTTASTSEDRSDGEDNSNLSQVGSDSVGDADFIDNIETARPPAGDPSRRLAVLGCHWSSISAADLFALFQTYVKTMQSNGPLRSTLNAFEDPEGCEIRLEKVSIYMSDFGVERVEKESIVGPELNVKNTTRKKDMKRMAESKPLVVEESDRDLLREIYDGGDELHAEKLSKSQLEALRTYERDRAKYYYAVLEFSDKAIAARLYDEMDGIEMDFFVDGVDLRFVPDALVIPREAVSVATEVPPNYEPPDAYRSALRHSNVNLTWDSDRPDRTKMLKKRFSAKELAELDLKDYLASSSEDDEDDLVENVIPTEWTFDVPDIVKKLENIGNEASPDTDKKPMFDRIDEENLADLRQVLLGSDAEEVTETEEDDDEGNGVQSISTESCSLGGPQRSMKHAATKSDSIETKRRGSVSCKLSDATRRPGDLEISFGAGLESLAEDIGKRLQPQKNSQASDEKTAGAEPAAGPWQEYLDKSKNKRKERKKDRRRYQRQEELEKEKENEQQQADEASGISKKKFPLIVGYPTDSEDDTFLTVENSNSQAETNDCKQKGLSQQNVQESPELARGGIVEDDDDDKHVETNRKKRRKELKAELRGLSKRQMRKRLAAAEIEEEKDLRVDVDDPRFSKLFADPQFGIDPTSPAFVDNPANRSLLQEVRKRQKRRDSNRPSKPDAQNGKGRHSDSTQSKNDSLPDFLHATKKDESFPIFG